MLSNSPLSNVGSQFVGNFVFGIANDAYIFGQDYAQGHRGAIRDLNGDYVSSKERLSAGMNTFQLFMAPADLAAVGVTSAAKTSERVFWSGGDIAKNAAMDFAKSKGMKTLEMTTGGRVVNSVGPYLPRSISSPIWNRLSRNFARGASGKINVFQNAAGVSLKSTWRRIEYPILQNNNIFYHIVK